MNKLIIVTLSIFILCSQAYGGEQFTGKQHKAQVKAAATEKGPYAKNDRWPSDYFLVPQNLPHMVGLSLYHPGSEVLGLSDQQKAAIYEIRNTTVSAVLRMAGPIKEKELELAEKLVDQKAEPQKLYALVDEIAAMRAELTKAHMTCIYKVLGVLDDKQHAVMLKFARKANLPQKDSQPEKNK